jgi:uncharacterized OB-fold protein
MTVRRIGRDANTAPFLDGTARGEFLLRRCHTGHWSEPAAQVCTTCGRRDLEWVASSGAARLVSWAVSYGRPKDDGPASRTVLAIVELDEGPWWWTRLVDVDPDAVAAGMTLRVGFERPGGEGDGEDEDEYLPVFRPAA